MILIACVCNSYPYYNAADTKSCNTITAWQEALRFRHQNVCFCRNFSLDCITPHRPAEEPSVSTRLRLCFMALAESCAGCSPQRAQLRLYVQTGGFNEHSLHKDEEKTP